jgi:hypothetical protein
MEAEGGYLHELRVGLVVTLAVVSVALGVVGWNLHPVSNGYQLVPQGLRIMMAGSGMNANEYLTQSGDSGATLKVSATGGRGLIPLRDTDHFTLLGGPQADGAAATSIGPGITFDGKPLPSARWAFIVLNPGSAQPCDAHAGYRAGRVTYPLQNKSLPALVVPPLPPQTSVGGTVAQAGLCLEWSTGSPFRLSGPYLSARFPPLRGVSGAVDYTQIPQTGDLGVATVTRVLRLDDGSTANFAIQTQPSATITYGSSWNWTIDHTPQVIQVAAINSSAAQRETNQAFYSGILFGVVGGALIALITELVVPLHRRPRRGQA